MDIKTITEGFGAVRELIELITKLGEETNNLALQKAILELDKKNYQLEKEILELKKELDKRDQYNMVFEKDKYWNILPDGTKDGPYCAACWDYSGKAVHLDQGFSSPHCHICFGAKNKN